MKKIIINAAPWQTRLAVTQEDILQNIYFEAHATQTLERCFFKGKVVKVLPGIQTAFVDIGQERSGFLHISEIDRELAMQKMTSGHELDELEEVPREHRQPSQRLDISKILTEGESVLVQVGKEPIGEKGAKLTTCFTLPGRFIVLMPNIPRIGISKKIEDRDERQRLRDLVGKNLPEGMGAIIRTTSEHKEQAELEQDIRYLVDTWSEIQRGFKEAPVQAKLHEDLPLGLQVVRDHLDSDVELVICDNKEMHAQIHKFVKQIAPEHAYKIRFYNEKTPLFEKFDLEKQIMQAIDRKVLLRSGGSIVIESTEAMTVVDVNTGRYIGTSNLEETILKTNMEAADEIVRQLRLRNIGGLIVIDFIDMATGANRQKLFKAFEKRLRERDKLQSVVLRVSEFGLVQMTRKRSGKTLSDQLTVTCNSCRGLGVVNSIQTESYNILRKLQKLVDQKPGSSDIMVTVHPSILYYITSTEYNTILQLEKQSGHKVVLVAGEQCELGYFDID
jgi:ribonuclease G